MKHFVWLLIFKLHKITRMFGEIKIDTILAVCRSVYRCLHLSQPNFSFTHLKIENCGDPQCYFSSEHFILMQFHKICSISVLQSYQCVHFSLLKVPCHFYTVCSLLRPLQSAEMFSLRGKAYNAPLVEYLKYALCVLFEFVYFDYDEWFQPKDIKQCV